MLYFGFRYESVALRTLGPELLGLRLGSHSIWFGLLIMLKFQILLHLSRPTKILQKSLFFFNPISDFLA